jgi:hypothetical protein
VYGFNTSGSGYGVFGIGGYYGVYGINNGDGFGVFGQSNSGAGLYSYSDTGAGVYGDTSYGWAGYFNGDVEITGTLYGGNEDVRIDHPLDPANKYLVHASVQSSEMKNIYDGVVTTDAHGEATVQLPEWFEALNTEFRYQLTVIGQFAQAIVARKITNHQFQIRTSAPNVEVSWQVTGVRQDAYAKAHPLQVETDKPQVEKGFYLHPELYGAPEEKGVSWAHSPQTMKKVREERTKLASPIDKGVAKP